jgi:hypothetical protein
MRKYDLVVMLRLILAVIVGAIMCLPVVLISGGNYYLILLLLPLVFVPVALIAPDVFLRGEYPRLRRRR